ncbi:hypothetical protein BKA69DRAFT_1071589 [Paraphysoderma sedebokerense]|nr:hypothetical protein BKA69DRAFT_1071589 [Paraphysoderma sedebokerense]
MYVAWGESGIGIILSIWGWKLWAKRIDISIMSRAERANFSSRAQWFKWIKRLYLLVHLLFAVIIVLLAIISFRLISPPSFFPFQPVTYLVPPPGTNQRQLQPLRYDIAGLLSALAGAGIVSFITLLIAPQVTKELIAIEEFISTSKNATSSQDKIMALYPTVKPRSNQAMMNVPGPRLQPQFNQHRINPMTPTNQQLPPPGSQRGVSPYMNAPMNPDLYQQASPSPVYRSPIHRSSNDTSSTLTYGTSRSSKSNYSKKSNGSSSTRGWTTPLSQSRRPSGNSSLNASDSRVNELSSSSKVETFAKLVGSNIEDSPFGLTANVETQSLPLSEVTSTSSQRNFYPNQKYNQNAVPPPLSPLPLPTPKVPTELRYEEPEEYLIEYEYAESDSSELFDEERETGIPFNNQEPQSPQPPPADLQSSEAVNNFLKAKYGVQDSRLTITTQALFDDDFYSDEDDDEEDEEEDEDMIYTLEDVDEYGNPVETTTTLRTKPRKGMKRKKNTLSTATDFTLRNFPVPSSSISSRPNISAGYGRRPSEALAVRKEYDQTNERRPSDSVLYESSSRKRY